VTPAAGLNPRAYRAPSASAAVPGVDAGMGRNIVDGGVLARWAELGAGRKAEVAGRVGFDGAAEVRTELRRVLGWGPLAYF
jgi:cleavage and polyadenylation specificity factor subunit 1